MTTSVTTPADLLRAVKLHLELYGWGQPGARPSLGDPAHRAWHDRSPHFCPYELISQKTLLDAKQQPVLCTRAVSAAAIVALYTAGGFSNSRDFVAWNDARGQTYAKVVSVIDKAIQSLE